MWNIPWPKTGPILLIYATDLAQIKKNALDTIKNKLCHNSVAAQQYFDAGTHPDFRLIEVESGSANIKIDAIRELNEWNASKPMLAACKMALMIKAENLNMQAANALLKTLEESTIYSQMILISNQPALVLPTIRSRCYTVHFKEQPCHSRAALDRGNSDPQTLLADLFEKLWLKSQVQAEEGRLIPNKAYWALVDKILQSQRFLSEGAPLNKNLLMSTVSNQYTAITSPRPLADPLQRG